jgi:hypothetical protein
MATANELRERIPGWGADLDLKNRPGVPREKTPPNGTGAHWDEPEQQIPTVKILVSTEHKGLTPVFGTTCPPKGLSGLVRELAFKFSEGQKLHWMMLLMADRIDVFESSLASILQLNAHNPLSEMGLGSELKRKGGFTSRFGQHRSDVKRQGRELMLLLGVGAGTYLIRKAVMARKAA